MADANSTQAAVLGRADTYIHHVDDVASYFECCSDTFGYLEAILASIQRAASGQSIDAGNLAKLADAGQYIAKDFEDLATRWREEVERYGMRIGDKPAAPFGDVVTYFKTCALTFGHLEAILVTIRQEATAQTFDVGSLSKLAGAGQYIANDYENQADCWREEVQMHGVRHG